MNRLVFVFVFQSSFWSHSFFLGLMGDVGYLEMCIWLSETEEAWFCSGCLLRCDQEVEATYFGRVSLLLLVTILRMFYPQSDFSWTFSVVEGIAHCSTPGCRKEIVLEWERVIYTHGFNFIEK